MSSKSRQVVDLLTHPEPFLTVGQLAEYWHVSRRQILKLIENGALEALRLGPKTFRIPTRAAIDLERRGPAAYRTAVK